MRIDKINYNIYSNKNLQKQKRNMTSPSFKSAGNAAIYANELRNIYPSSVAAEALVHNVTNLLVVDGIRKFFSDFIRGVRDSKTASDREKENIFLFMSYSYEAFMRKIGSYYRSSEEEIFAHEMKCSYADIADKNGNLRESSLRAAHKIAQEKDIRYNLESMLAGAKDADGTINDAVAIAVKTLVEKLGSWKTSEVIKFKGFYRDKDGNVNRDLVRQINNAFKDDIPYLIQHYGLKTEEEIFKEYEKENLYIPENFLKFLRELAKNKYLYTDDTKILDKEIGDYGSIFMLIADVVRDENHKEKYSELINYLSNFDLFDFDKKDKNSISFMEKVINSENLELLKLVNKQNRKGLTYYPELDLAYEGVQSEEFKKELKKTTFEFKDLEKAAELRSITAMRKLAKQLDSKLCDKEEMILYLWKIAATRTNGIDTKKEFGKYLCDTYINEISIDTMFKIMNQM